MNRGSDFFEHDTIRQLLSRTAQNVKADTEHALANTAPVKSLLFRLAHGRSNSVCIWKFRAKKDSDFVLLTQDEI